MSDRKQRPGTHRPRGPLTGAAVILGWTVAWGLLVSAVCPAPNHPSLIAVHGGPNDTTMMDRMRDAGFKWMRIGVSWRQIEPQESVFDWSVLDPGVGSAFTRGFSILLYFSNVPGWANGNGSPTTPPNLAHKDSFGDFLRAVLLHVTPTNLRIGELVPAFEMWNEPNLSYFWTGDAATWRDRILRPGIAAILELRQSQGFTPALIVAPSTYTNYDRGDPIDISQWVQGYGANINAFSVHTYGSEATQLAEIDDANAWCNGNGNCLEFWVTEAGFETYGCGQANCTTNPGAALLHTQNRCVNKTWCYKNFIFHARDVENDSGLVTNTYLVRNRLCYLEQNYVGLLPTYPSPLVVAEPCPCSAGKPGCANEP